MWDTRFIHSTSMFFLKGFPFFNELFLRWPHKINPTNSVTVVMKRNETFFTIKKKKLWIELPHGAIAGQSMWLMWLVQTAALFLNPPSPPLPKEPVPCSTMQAQPHQPSSLHTYFIWNAGISPGIDRTSGEQRKRGTKADSSAQSCVT